MVLDWYKLLCSCLPIFPRDERCSDKVLLDHGDWKKHLFFYFPHFLEHDEESESLDDDHSFTRVTCVRYVSVDNLIQPPPSDEPFLSRDDAEVEILRARQSLRRRGGYANRDDSERIDDIGWRGLGYSVFLTHKETTPPPTKIFKMMQHMASINVGHKLYFLGGHAEEEFANNWKDRQKQRLQLEFSKQVHCYDLLKEDGGHFRCADMLESGSGCRLFENTPPFVVQVDGKIYVLCYFKNKNSENDDLEEALNQAHHLYEEVKKKHFHSSNEVRDAYRKFENAENAVASASLTLCFQEYNIDKNEWTLLPLFDGTENFDFPLNNLSHVVIDKKLCISFGKSSFAFDTVNCIWEDCMLFGSNNKMMYREEFIVANVSQLKELFTGRGILWGVDILLGVCGQGVVAFQLVEGRVVNRKELSLNIDTDGMCTGLDSNCDPTDIVDLGGGYFCLIHAVRNAIVDDYYNYWDHGDLYSLALVTFRVTRPEKKHGDHEFITCQVVEPKALLLRSLESYNAPLHAFCV